MAKFTNTNAMNAKPRIDPDTGRSMQARYSAGAGLILTVRSDTAKSWSVRAMKDGRRQEIGLGSYPDVSLAEAREAADRVRRQIRSRVDVKEEKRKLRKSAIEAQDRTFEKVTTLFHDETPDNGTRTRSIWLGRMQRFAFPKLGSRPIDSITGPDIVATLAPIWNAKPETARRVQQAIGLVLTRAHARGWRGPVPPLPQLLRDALPPHRTAARHHPAVDYADAPDVVATLMAGTETTGRAALLFTIFTAVRSGETRLATWSEIDMDAALWSIPADRMKMRRDHVVPLTSPALAMLRRQRAAARLMLREGEDVAQDAFVFPGARQGSPISDMTMNKVNAAVAPGTVPHGWRSTFRDWAGNETAHPSDVCEAALAHLIGNTTSRAYQRGTMLEKRRALMADWADYLVGGAAA